MTIPVGAKVIIHHTRGGIVVLPITPEAGVDAVAVDVPTIIGCKVTTGEPNFFYLSWIPGTNNDNVFMDVKAGSYVTTPNTGEIKDKFPITSKTAKVRFPAASTTYYVKLWGMRNGKYSPTGAGITVTSGASVTPPGPVDPPIDPTTRWVQSVVSVTLGLYGDANNNDRFLYHGDVNGTVDCTTLVGAPGSATLQFAIDLLASSRIDVYEDYLGDMYSFDPRISQVFTFHSEAGEDYTVTILNHYELKIECAAFAGSNPTNIPFNISGIYAHP